MAPALRTILACHGLKRAPTRLSCYIAAVMGVVGITVIMLANLMITSTEGGYLAVFSLSQLSPLAREHPLKGGRTIEVVEVGDIAAKDVDHNAAENVVDSHLTDSAENAQAVVSTSTHHVGIDMNTSGSPQRPLQSPPATLEAQNDADSQGARPCTTTITTATAITPSADLSKTQGPSQLCEDVLASSTDISRPSATAISLPTPTPITRSIIDDDDYDTPWTQRMPTARPWIAAYNYCQTPPPCVDKGPQTMANATVFAGMRHYLSAFVLPGERLRFGIIARDGKGNARRCGGDSFQVRLEGPSLYAGQAEDNLDGTYSFSAVLFDEGDYEVRARLDFTACEGSFRCVADENVNKTMVAQYIRGLDDGGGPVIIRVRRVLPAEDKRRLLIASTAAHRTAGDDGIVRVEEGSGSCGARFAPNTPIHDPSMRVGRWYNRTMLCGTPGQIPGMKSVSDSPQMSMPPVAHARDDRRCDSPFFSGPYIWVPMDSARPVLPVQSCRDVWLHFVGDSMTRNNFMRLNDIFDATLGAPVERMAFLRIGANGITRRQVRHFSELWAEERVIHMWTRYSSHNVTLTNSFITPYVEFSREMIRLNAVPANANSTDPLTPDDSRVPTHLFMNTGLHNVCGPPEWHAQYPDFVGDFLSRFQRDYPRSRTAHFWITTTLTQFTAQQMPRLHRCATSDRINAVGDYAADVALRANVTRVWDYYQFSAGRHDATRDNRHYNNDVMSFMVDELLNMVCVCNKKVT